MTTAEGETPDSAKPGADASAEPGRPVLRIRSPRLRIESVSAPTAEEEDDLGFRRVRAKAVERRAASPAQAFVEAGARDASVKSFALERKTWFGLTDGSECAYYESDYRWLASCAAEMGRALECGSPVVMAIVDSDRSIAYRDIPDGFLARVGCSGTTAGSISQF